MLPSIIMCFAASILFNKSDGRFHRRNKLVRRQNAQMPPPSNMMQGPAYPAPPVESPNPPAYAIPPSLVISPSQPPPHAFNPMPPLPSPYVANTLVSSGSAPFPVAPEPASYDGNNPQFGPNGQEFKYPTLATANPLSQNLNSNPVPLNKRENLFRKNAQENIYAMKYGESPRMLHSHFNPFRGRVDRRRKSVAGKRNNVVKVNKVHRNLKPASTNRKTKDAFEKKAEMVKLLEEGNKILEMSTESKVEGGETSSKSLDNFFGDDDDDGINGNVTVIPIPEGIQLKTNSEKNNKHVEETVNITSSTQKTLSVDNNTEIENVMEMEMEKKIEDDKGDSKGSEQVKIVETERVKPIMIKKGKDLTHKHRKRHFHLRKLFKRHRSKRGTTNSESFYSKMMKKFLSDLKRRVRTGRIGSLNRTDITTPEATTKVTKKTDWVFKSENNISVRDKSVYDSDEMEEFLKHILSQLVKLRKTRDKNKVRNTHLQYFEFRQKNNDLNFTKHRKKQHNYPEHLKMIMNLNMTLDDKLQRYLQKSVKKTEWSENIPMDSRLTNSATSTTQRAYTILYLHDKKDTDSGIIITIFILCMMTFLLPLLLCILPQLYKTSKMKKEHSALKNCPFCPESKNNKGKERICRFHGENFASEECLQLEWQSDNGDWLSEKEIEFK